MADTERINDSNIAYSAGNHFNQRVATVPGFCLMTVCCSLFRPVFEFPHNNRTPTRSPRGRRERDDNGNTGRPRRHIKALALTFAPIIGPFAPGAQVSVAWTLDGSEPLNGWELWFDAGGSAVRVGDVPPLTLSTVVPFPGSNGTFQGLDGIHLLATSNEVDVTTPTLPTLSITATATFSASVISGSSASVVSGSSSSVSIFEAATSSATPSASSAAESSRPTKASAISTEAILGIIVGTLAVIAVIVFASISLFVRRRRRAATSAYPFEAADVEKQLAIAKRITTFHVQDQSLTSPPRGSSRPLPPPDSRPSSAADLRRTAYLNSQLQRLDVPHTDPDSGSIFYGPLSSAPSEAMPRSLDLEAEHPPVSRLTPIPEQLSGSRRAAYLAEQLERLEVVERRRSEGSVAFGPLSSVPSESTASDGAAPSISTTTTIQSPLQFLQPAMTSPVSPVTRVAPWSSRRP
ncbi:hypothetical protein DFH06DRAFT_1369014 [Mycena polygramma]|nr:hypothetical protein DFH06DRAFT_1369014 [Mycena polygramma]